MFAILASLNERGVDGVIGSALRWTSYDAKRTSPSQKGRLEGIREGMKQASIQRAALVHLFYGRQWCGPGGLPAVRALSELPCSPLRPVASLQTLEL